MTSCGSIPSGPKPSPDGPAEPLAFHQVTEIRPTPCPSGPDLTYVDPNEQQSCLVLGPSRLTITRLERVDVEQDQSGQWVVQLTVPADAADDLAALTTELAAKEAPENRLAMILGAELITAATVQGPITGGELQLAGRFTREQAEDVRRRLGG
ncbi:MAG TPA: hypothetical protein VK020_07545 [Microlunatus sp.]|nr:hypothetical protein [Microlunatus sp.]